MEIEYEVTRTSTTTTREIVMEGGTSTKTVTMSGGGGGGGSLVMEKVCNLGLISFFRNPCRRFNFEDWEQRSCVGEIS